jgi:hypothetical protein
MVSSYSGAGWRLAGNSFWILIAARDQEVIVCIANSRTRIKLKKRTP